MKKILLLSALITFYLMAMSFTLFAQPVITSSIVLPAVGTADSVFTAAAIVAPGAGGAGITWNLSTLSLSFGAVLTVEDPSTTPYASVFPTSNFSFQLAGPGTVYNYNKKSSAGFETVATSYAGTGTGQDYSPNPRLAVPFPFSYMGTAIDTYQTTTSAAEEETLTYDGYGTLVTPLHTYTNVVRVKEDYGGADYHYAWYSVSPFMLIMDYSNTGNNYVYIAEAPGVAATHTLASTPVSVTFIPNPVINQAILRIDVSVDLKNASLSITDATGKLVRKVPVTSTQTIIQKGDLSDGIYYYSVNNNGKQIAAGKFAVL